MRKLAEWVLGELPAEYPPKRLAGRQGIAGVRKQLEDEGKREELNSNLRHRAHPSGLIVRQIRRGIVRLNFLRIQVWIDEARDRLAFNVLRRTPQNVGGDRDLA